MQIPARSRPFATRGMALVIILGFFKPVFAQPQTSEREHTERKNAAAHTELPPTFYLTISECATTSVDLTLSKRLHTTVSRERQPLIEHCSCNKSGIQCRGMFERAGTYVTQEHVDADYIIDDTQEPYDPTDADAVSRVWAQEAGAGRTLVIDARSRRAATFMMWGSPAQPNAVGSIACSGVMARTLEELKLILKHGPGEGSHKK